MLNLIKSCTGHEGRVWHVGWSCDGRYFASCGEDKVIRVWGTIEKWSDTSKLSCIATLEEGQSRTIRSCEWSPDGGMIASASFDGTVVIWQALDRNLKHWEQIASLEGHDNEVKSVAWSHSGTFLASCSRDKKVWIWERLSGGEFECVSILDGHSQDVKFVAWHPSDELLFSASYDDTIKLWRQDEDDWFCHSTLPGHESTVWGIAISADGRYFCSCSDDKSIFLWESDSPSNPDGDWRRVAAVRGTHTDPIYTIHWNKARNFIVSSGGDNRIVVYDLLESSSEDVTLTVRCTKDNSHDSDINCVRWSPLKNENSDLLISASDDSLIKIWRYESNV